MIRLTYNGIIRSVFQCFCCTFLVIAASSLITRLHHLGLKQLKFKMPHQSSQTHFSPEPPGGTCGWRRLLSAWTLHHHVLLLLNKTLHLRLFKEASTNNPTNETGDFGTAVDMVTVVTRAAQTIPHRRRERRRVVSGSFPGMVFHLHLVYWVRSTADM